MFFSCSSKEAENGVGKKPIASIESNNGNLVVHFTDNTTQSFSTKQIKQLTEEHQITKNTYLLYLQKLKEEKLQMQRKHDDEAKEKRYPYRLNGRDVYRAEFKEGKYIVQMADKTSHTFLQHELDCMMINNIITTETYLLCMRKQADAINSTNSGFSFSYREIKCPEFN